MLNWWLPGCKFIFFRGHCRHARIQSFVRGGGGATVTFFFCFFFVFVLVDEGREDPNTTISGPSSARQRNAILMAFRWCAGDGT